MTSDRGFWSLVIVLAVVWSIVLGFFGGLMIDTVIGGVRL